MSITKQSGTLNCIPFETLCRLTQSQGRPSAEQQDCRYVQFYKDASSRTLPQVSWIIPSVNVSEHPSAGVREGMAYVIGLVNAIIFGP